MNEMSHVAGAVDVMQVCRNGHVITDLLQSWPERALGHCDRCGAQTLDRCLTCGDRIPGAILVPGLPTAGTARPPNYCATCGAAFPWTGRPSAPVFSSRGLLEDLLRRLPLVVRQLRWRQSERPPLRIEDRRDLEDLLRAMLTVYFDDIRLEKRTPRYSAGPRTDFLLFPQKIALACKLAAATDVANEIREDGAYYREAGHCRSLICCVYDPEGRLREPAALEKAWSSQDDVLEVHCLIAT